jgi:hypothetical protein
LHEPLHRPAPLEIQLALICQDRAHVALSMQKVSILRFDYSSP